MNVLSWIIFGAIAGWIASLITRRKRSGCITNIFLGIAGSVIGGLLFEFFGAQGVTGFDIYSLFVAIVGAIVLLAIINIASGNNDR
jgi:uncharacterized membrane protein YeaQ/YmgE (transglycosylase-associated protein family)